MLFCTCKIDAYLVQNSKQPNPPPQPYTCTYVIARKNTLAALYMYKNYYMEILI